MKIYSVSVLLAPPSQHPAVLATVSDLSDISFYQRGAVAEFIGFFSRSVAERTGQGQRQRVEEDKYTAHVYNRGGTEQLAAVIVTDKEYPATSASSILTKLLEEFVAKVPQSSLSNPSAIDFAEIQTYLSKYQDPRQADTI